MIYKIRKPHILLIALAISILGLSACSEEEHPLLMASPDEMPADVQTAPVVVREAYQFAAANPDVMEHIPCYCGCGDIGHTSNYSCYVAGVDEAGNVSFDNHALGCSICVDITQDAMRLSKEGKTVAEIKAYVDSTYSKFGKSNMP